MCELGHVIPFAGSGQRDPRDGHDIGQWGHSGLWFVHVDNLSKVY